MENQIKLPVIRTENLSFSYQDVAVLKNISFGIQEGTISAIVGPNGSGKTTLLKLLLGFLKPESGKVFIFDGSPKEMRRKVGYVPQRFDFDRSFPITVEEFLQISCPKDKAHLLDDHLNHLGVLNLKDRTLGSLSGGQLQRVLIARAVLPDPEILFLDEPSSGIDMEGERSFLELIVHLKEEHNMTVIMISHEINVVNKVADQVLCINQSLICFGAPQKVLTAKTLEDLYKRPIAIYHHHD